MAQRMLPALVASALLCATAAQAKDDSFAIIFNNTKNDGGFNESALRGVERFKAETGLSARENVIRSEEESVRSLRTFAENGVKNIVAISFTNEAAVATVAKDFPNVHFTLIDGSVNLPNVRSVLFREDEAAYLAGVAAALASKANKVAFVGGMPIPPVRRFECGFVQGVQSVAPKTEVIRAYLGDQPTVFRDKALGTMVGTDVLNKGADVLFAAAGFGGNGAIEAAAEKGKLSIGVDTNQNGLFPGKVLTSATKRVDVAVYNAFKDGFDDKWTAGTSVLGIAEHGVDLARDTNNAALFEPVAAAVEKATADIASGTVKLEDYTKASACQ